MQEKPKPKRFEANQQGEVGEQLAKAFQSGVDQLCRKLPEIVGGTQFGSLTRGTATDGSDIDGYVFIDIDLLLEEMPTFTRGDVLDYRTGGLFEKNDPSMSITGTFDRNKKLPMYYKKLVHDMLEQQVGSRVDDYVLGHLRPAGFRISDVGILPMSKIGIKEIVNRLGVLSEEERDLLPKVLRLPKVHLFTSIPDPDGYRIPAWVYVIAPLFHMAVGGDIRPYRKVFLQALSKLEDRQHGLGDTLWGDVVKYLEEWEQKTAGKSALRNAIKRFVDGEGPQYPQTLKEAIRRYSPDMI